VELRINDRIRNRKVDFFNNFQVSLRYDAISSTFAFGFFFNPDNIEHKEMSCIGHYHLATVEHNGELLVSGYILSEAFNSASRKQLTHFSGYSLTGPLEDCEIPTSLYPLQSDGLTLREIAQKLIQPFGLQMVVDSSVSSKMDQAYEKTTARESQTIKSYLQELCSQKNIILSHDERGRLLFTSAKTNQKPILNFDVINGGIPFTNMSLQFNGQGMHSDITVIKQADKDGGNAGESTVSNPYVPFVYRPRVIVQNSGDDIDTEQAAKNARAAELKNLKLTITTDRWLLNDKVIRPNNLITVVNPEVYLYQKSTWFIEQIDLVGDQEKTVATLTCCLPEVYNLQEPKYLFEGINLH
jgi:prophage tail gpP-like protein